MRINLVTPFTEKDTVKTLGARWDATKKCWYIVDIADLKPFARWIPNMEAAKDSSERTSTKPRFTLPTPATDPEDSASHKADCGCDVLPWDDCPHTAKA
jgi:hypothetical protein